MPLEARGLTNLEHDVEVSLLKMSAFANEYGKGKLDKQICHCSHGRWQVEAFITSWNLQCY